MLQATLALVLLLIFLIFWVIRRTYSFWNGKGIPYLSFTDYVNLVYDNFTKPLHEVALKNYRRRGRLYGSYEGFVPTLAVGDPQLLRDIYVKDFKSFSDRIASNATGNPLWDKMMLNSPEEEWKATRTMMSPAFTTSRLKAMIPKIIATTKEFCKRLLREGEKKAAVEVSEIFEACAMDTTAALVYSLDLNTHENPDHPLVKCCKGFFGNLGGWKMILLFTMSRVFKLLPLEFPSKKGTEYVKEFTRHMAQQRCASKEKLEDVLQLCLDTVMSERSPDNFKISESEIEDIAAQCMLFFIAGSDTVTITLTWTAYCLALHPECQEKIIEEIDNAVKQNGITYESLKEMPYLEAAINETLRLHTPDSMLNKKMHPGDVSGWYKGSPRNVHSNSDPRHASRPRILSRTRLLQARKIPARKQGGSRPVHVPSFRCRATELRRTEDGNVASQGDACLSSPKDQISEVQ
uniref:Putative cytochrome p450 cyp3/cyp5/cyp6/cyp9 subfamily n=1 Tax=Ixodes ricinus TaxID=34613 RepID=V5GLK3_IXORI